MDLQAKLAMIDDQIRSFEQSKDAHLLNLARLSAVPETGRNHEWEEVTKNELRAMDDIDRAIKATKTLRDTVATKKLTDLSQSVNVQALRDAVND